MATLLEEELGKEMKQRQNNHTDEEIEISLMDIFRKIIAIRKAIYKAAGIGLVIGIIIAISIQSHIFIFRHRYFHCRKFQ